jgi:cysteine-rich repeat protein
LEECDDGDLVAGNGCSAQCKVEPGWSCRGSPSICGKRVRVWEVLEPWVRPKTQLNPSQVVLSQHVLLFLLGLAAVERDFFKASCVGG